VLASVPKPTRSLPQVSIADDIIAIEHAARLVAAQFHRHAFGNAGADHVPDGGAAEVVRNTTRATGGEPGAAPIVVEAGGRDRMPGPEPDVAVLGGHVVEEDVLDDNALPTLNPISSFALRLQQILQLRCQVEYATFEILRRPWVQTDLTGLHVDLPPLQRQDLAVDAPTRNERERLGGRAAAVLAPDEQTGGRHDIREADLAKEHQPTPGGIDGFSVERTSGMFPSGSMMRNSVTTAEMSKRDYMGGSFAARVRPKRVSMSSTARVRS